MQSQRLLDRRKRCDRLIAAGLSLKLILSEQARIRVGRFVDRALRLDSGAKSVLMYNLVRAVVAELADALA